MPGDWRGVNDFPVGDGADFIARLAVVVAVNRADVDPFVEACVNNAVARLFGIAHESILSAFPRRRFLAVIIALDVLIERRAAAVKDRVIVSRQRKLKRAGVLAGTSDQDRSPCYCKPPRHRFFFSPMSRQSFFIDSISALVRLEAM